MTDNLSILKDRMMWHRDGPLFVDAGSEVFHATIEVDGVDYNGYGPTLETALADLNTALEDWGVQDDH